MTARFVEQGYGEGEWCGRIVIFGLVFVMLV
jgi:hypothetical protein